MKTNKHKQRDLISNYINSVIDCTDIEKVLKDELKYTTHERTTFDNGKVETVEKYFGYEGPKASDLFYKLITCNILNIK